MYDSRESCTTDPSGRVRNGIGAAGESQTHEGEAKAAREGYSIPRDDEDHERIGRAPDAPELW